MLEVNIKAFRACVTDKGLDQQYKVVRGGRLKGYYSPGENPLQKVLQLQVESLQKLIEGSTKLLKRLEDLQFELAKAVSEGSFVPHGGLVGVGKASECATGVCFNCGKVTKNKHFNKFKKKEEYVCEGCVEELTNQ